MTSDNDEVFQRVAVELDAYASVPVEELAHRVRVDGSCGWLYATGEVPQWTGDDRADRETAASVCVGCPVQRECLEWEFRTHGHATSGVWGPLDEQGRRAVFVHWADRRDDDAFSGGA